MEHDIEYDCVIVSLYLYVYIYICYKAFRDIIHVSTHTGNHYNHILLHTHSKKRLNCWPDLGPHWKIHMIRHPMAAVVGHVSWISLLWIIGGGKRRITQFSWFQIFL